MQALVPPLFLFLLELSVLDIKNTTSFIILLNYFQKTTIILITVLVLCVVRITFQFDTWCFYMHILPYEGTLCIIPILSKSVLCFYSGVSLCSSQNNWNQTEGTLAFKISHPWEMDMCIKTLLCGNCLKVVVIS